MTFQVGSALLDACVLAILQREDAYGYILTQNMKELISVSESTLYPILRRLQKEDYLTVYDVPFSGRNRRYYHITESGKGQLAEYIREWKEYKDNVDKIFAGGTNDE
jgi:PadR family transcriptional regulator PadR